MPAAVVPMASQIDRVVGYHDEVKCPYRDGEVASGAQVLLGGLIGLDRADRYVEKMAHTMTAIVATSAITTIAISAADFS